MSDSPLRNFSVILVNWLSPKHLSNLNRITYVSSHFSDCSHVVGHHSRPGQQSCGGPYKIWVCMLGLGEWCFSTRLVKSTDTYILRTMIRVLAVQAFCPFTMMLNDVRDFKASWHAWYVSSGYRRSHASLVAVYEQIEIVSARIKPLMDKIHLLSEVPV